MSQCRSCGAEILWARNPNTGKRIPLDAKSETWFELHDTDPGDVTPEAVPLKVYRSHFATCPQAEEWRKGG